MTYNAPTIPKHKAIRGADDFAFGGIVKLLTVSDKCRAPLQQTLIDERLRVQRRAFRHQTSVVTELRRRELQAALGQEDPLSQVIQLFAQL